MSQPSQGIRNSNLSSLVYSDVSHASISGQNVTFSIGSVSNSFELPASMEFVPASESMLEPISSFAFDFGPSSEFMSEPVSLSTPEPMQVCPLESVAEFVFSSISMLEPIPSFSVDIEPMSPSAPDFVLEFMPVSESMLEPISSSMLEFLSEFELEPIASFTSESMFEPMSLSAPEIVLESMPEFVSEFVLSHDPQPSLVPPVILRQTPVLPVAVSVPLALSVPLSPQNQACSSYSAFIQMLGVEEENIFTSDEQKRELALSQLISAVDFKRQEAKELLMHLGWVVGSRGPTLKGHLLSEAVHCHRLLVLAYIILLDRTMLTSRNIKAILVMLYPNDNGNKPLDNKRKDRFDKYVTALSDWCMLHLKFRTGFIVKKMNTPKC